MWVRLDKCVMRGHMLSPTLSVYQVALAYISNYEESKL